MAVYFLLKRATLDTPRAYACRRILDTKYRIMSSYRTRYLPYRQAGVLAEGTRTVEHRFQR